VPFVCHALIISKQTISTPQQICFYDRALRPTEGSKKGGWVVQIGNRIHNCAIQLATRSWVGPGSAASPLDGLDQGKEQPRDIDGALLGWAKKFTKGEPSAYYRLEESRMANAEALATARKNARTEADALRGLKRLLHAGANCWSSRP
jgi:hypothetical protein